jgi:hypothetical protein
MSSARYLSTAMVLGFLCFAPGCSSENSDSSTGTSAAGATAGKAFVAAQVRAKITLDGAISLNASGDTLRVPVQVDNQGIVDFDSSANPSVDLGSELADGNNKVVYQDFIRTPLGLIKAGSKATVVVDLPVAKLAGHAVLIVPVQEGVAWFTGFGVEPLHVGPFAACDKQGASGTLCMADGMAIPVK